MLPSFAGDRKHALSMHEARLKLEALPASDHRTLSRTDASKAPGRVLISPNFHAFRANLEDSKAPDDSGPLVLLRFQI